LTHHLEALERPIDPAGTVHILLELSILFWLGFGGSVDGLDLLQRTSRHAGGLGGLISGAAP
jgi:hypothetical protein